MFASDQHRLERAEMTDPRLEDHLTGLELQLVDLEERRKRASVQGRTEDAAGFARQIEELQKEMAATAEQISGWD